jgi:hypothetical protein
VASPSKACGDILQPVLRARAGCATVIPPRYGTATTQADELPPSSVRSIARDISIHHQLFGSPARAIWRQAISFLGVRRRNDLGSRTAVWPCIYSRAEASLDYALRCGAKGNDTNRANLISFSAADSALAREFVHGHQCLGKAEANELAASTANVETEAVDARASSIRANGASEITLLPRVGADFQPARGQRGTRGSILSSVTGHFSAATRPARRLADCRRLSQGPAGFETASPQQPPWRHARHQLAQALGFMLPVVPARPG